MPEIRMSARIGAIIVAAAVRGGATAQAMRAATGFDPDLARDPDARISLDLEAALWAAAARLTGDDAIGLHAIEHLEPGAFEVLEYAIRTAPTVGAALDRLARYNRIEHDAAVFTSHRRGDVVRIEHAFRIAGGAQSRHSADFTVGSLVVVPAMLSGAPVAPRVVELVGPPPASPRALAEHERVFGLRPRFGTAVNAIELPAEVLDRPCPAADPALSRVIERHAEAMLAAYPDPTATTSERARGLLAGALADNDATLAAIARRLGMSERSLQRRLGDEGRTFEALVDEVRRELAQRYLADPSLAIAEVAYLLAFSEPSAFHRAFKRWTGITPAAARAARA